VSKAFTKEPDEPNDEENDPPPPLPPNAKNYMTPAGYATLQAESRQLQRVERPKVVEVVSWAAGNGDRSENGDYIYGKKRLREIDRRLRYLKKQMDSAEVVDPAKQQGLTRVFFGATVTYADEQGAEHTYQIVGIDEADLTAGKISFLSPLARTLMKAQEGDTVELRSPGGVEKLDILTIAYRLVE
jgi:transcription elongation factor GreB